MSVTMHKSSRTPSAAATIMETSDNGALCDMNLGCSLIAVQAKLDIPSAYVICTAEITAIAAVADFTLWFLKESLKLVLHHAVPTKIATKIIKTVAAKAGVQYTVVTI